MVASALTHPVELSEQPTEARRELTRLLVDAGWGGDVDGVALAVHEAMVNAQRHAGGVKRAAAALEDDSLVVEVTDRGQGFGIPDRPALPLATAERGRGLFLIRQLSTDARVVQAGRDVCLRLRFEG